MGEGPGKCQLLSGGLEAVSSPSWGHHRQDPNIQKALPLPLFSVLPIFRLRYPFLPLSASPQWGLGLGQFFEGELFSRLPE